MVVNKFLSFLMLIILISCNELDKKESSTVATPESTFTTSIIALKNTTPTVDILNYTLIEDSNKNRQKDADEILNVKRRWPLAMQSQNAEEFEAILAKDFTFNGIGEFFNREDYIKNRLQPDNWKITYVKYDNLSLQFIGELAILTYKNSIKNVNSITKETEIEVISWTDVFIK